MFNSLNISELLKRPMVFASILVGLIVLVLVYSFLTSIKPTPSWNELKPGTSTKKDVEKKLGEPKKQIDIKNFKVLGYKSDFENRLHEIWLESEKVVLIKEQINPKANKKLSSFKDLSGNRLKLYSVNFGEAQVLNFYEEDGLAILANKNTGLVTEVWYFKPMNAGNFNVKFDAKLSNFEPTRPN